MRLRRAGRTVVSRRDADGWVVVEPAGTAIPPDLIEAFATALTGAEEIVRIGDGQGDLRTYGLDERAAQVEIIAARLANGEKKMPCSLRTKTRLMICASAPAATMAFSEARGMSIVVHAIVKAKKAMRT